MSSTEEEALAALDRGDRKEALTRLMRGYGDAVYQFCLQNLRDAAAAEDVRQQTFVQAWSDLPRYSRRSSLKTWLFGIAHHRCLDWARRDRRLQAHLEPVRDALPEVDDPAPLADTALDQDALAKEIAHCLQQLAPAAQNAVSLRYGEGFSYEEMADISGEKPGTLQARVARALPVIRKCLERKGVIS